MTEPIAEDRLRELRELAWNPAYLPPAEEKILRYRHEALRDAVREIDRFTGRARSTFNIMQALLDILARHRIMTPVPPHGELPKLLTDLMEWSSVNVVCETHDPRAERDQLREQLDEIGKEATGQRPEAPAALWDCPTSPSRGQRAHRFDEPLGACLYGCGMTWARLQEAI